MNTKNYLIILVFTLIIGQSSNCSGKYDLLSISPSTMVTIAVGAIVGGLLGKMEAEITKQNCSYLSDFDPILIPHALAAGSFAIFAASENKQGMILTGSYLVGAWLGYITFR